MSLRVWLPLNKDLRNQGLSNVTVTNNGATFSDGCANFTTTQYSMKISSIDFSKLTHASISFWIKINQNDARWLPFSSLSGYYIMATDNGGSSFYHDHTGGTKTIYKDGISTTSVNDGNWHHYCITDVNLSTWSNFFINYYGGTGSAYNWTGSLYDVRIYDHALSKKEVAELARGCVLHYPMNDTLNESTVNLNGTYYQNWSAYTSYWTIIENTLNSIKLKASRTVDNNTVALINSSLLSQLSINDIITISGYLYKGDVPHKASINQTSTTDSYQQISFKSRDDGYFESTVKVIGSGAWIFHAALFGSTTTNDICYIKNLQIEKKDHATPYTPTSRTQNLLKDVSGFDNHSLITGSLPLVTTPKSPRYDKCMNIDNSGTNKNYANCTIAAPQVKSASFWVYIGSSIPSTSTIIFQDKPSHLAFGFYLGTNVILYSGTSETAKPCRYYIINNSDPNYNVKYNSWNHFCISQLDNYTTEMWLNNIKQLNPTSEWWGENYDGFCFGARNNSATGISFPFTGKISDFRLFSRVLTQSDVDGLYKDSFAIDKSQNGYCYELNESDAQSSVDIKKNGQLKCKNYSETITSFYDDNAYIEPDGSVWIRIFHHNNPANALFSQTDSFDTKVYKDADRWLYTSVCNLVNKWEFMAKEKVNSTDTTEYKFRWRQTKNPLLATWNDVGSANITKVTDNGYSEFGRGGIYKASNSGHGNTYIIQNDGSAGDWMGAIGSWTSWGLGIPAFGSLSSIGSGYMDLYLRIDNLDEGTLACLGKTGVTMNEIYEI